MELDVRLAGGDASRYAPYERTVFYEDTDDRGFWQYDVNTGRNQTQFSFVDDENENIGFDLTIPVKSITRNSFLRLEMINLITIVMLK